MAHCSSELESRFFVLFNVAPSHVGLKKKRKKKQVKYTQLLKLAKCIGRFVHHIVCIKRKEKNKISLFTSFIQFMCSVYKHRQYIHRASALGWGRKKMMRFEEARERERHEKMTWRLVRWVLLLFHWKIYTHIGTREWIHRHSYIYRNIWMCLLPFFYSSSSQLLFRFRWNVTSSSDHRLSNHWSSQWRDQSLLM